MTFLITGYKKKNRQLVKIQVEASSASNAVKLNPEIDIKGVRIIRLPKPSIKLRKS